MPGPKILVVDDDAMVRDSVARVLERAGYRVRTHDSGFGLIMALREFRPDLLLLDIGMPGLRGDAALRALQQFEQQGVPCTNVALFSGLPPDELAEKAAELGVAAIGKPVPPGRLLERVAELVAAGPRRRAG